MTRTSILKGLAICSSVLLAGGFVVYRQKQAASPEGEVEMMSGSKSRPVVTHRFETSDESVTDPSEPHSSGVDGIPADSAEPEKGLLPEAKSPRRPVLLPSSKNIDAILANPSRQGTPPVPASGQEKPSESGTGKTLLPSSKIGAILTPEDTSTKAPEKRKENGKPEEEP